jgi:hypothetical protein
MVKKQSLIDRKLQDLDRESARIRSEIRAAKRRARSGAPPPAAPAAPRYHSPNPDAEQSLQHRPVSGIPEEPPAVEQQQDYDLFHQPHQPERPSSRPPRAVEEPAVASRPVAASRDDRLANYLTTGSFVARKATRQSKSVQRNKAIFMLIVVVIVFIVLMQFIR